MQTQLSDSCWRLIDYWIPQSKSLSQSRLFHERFVVSITLVTALYFSVAMVLAAALPGTSAAVQYLVSILLCTTMLGALISLLLLRFCNTPVVAVNSFIFYLCLGFTYWAAQCGGLASPAVVCLGTLPLIALFGAGVPSCILWNVVVLGIWANFFTNATLGLPTAGLTEAEQQAATSLSLFTTLWLSGFVSVYYYISSKVLRRKFRSQFSKYLSLANQDPLTGLANRRYFLEALKEEISAAEESERNFCLLYIDLNNFKFANDNYGHHFGDEVLLRFAEALKSVVRKGDLLARIGGDEFCAILSGVGDSSAAQNKIALLSELTAETLSIEGIPYRLSSSVGYAVYPEDGTNYEVLMRHADRQMYRAKRMGKPEPAAVVSSDKLTQLRSLKQLSQPG